MVTAFQWNIQTHGLLRQLPLQGLCQTTGSEHEHEAQCEDGEDLLHQHFLLFLCWSSTDDTLHFQLQAKSVKHLQNSKSSTTNPEAPALDKQLH